VRGGPALLLVVPFKHRKSTTQRNFSSLGSSSLWRSCYFCAANRRNWPQAWKTVSSGAVRAARRPAGEQQQIVFPGVAQLAHAGHGSG